ncbi:YkgJ family cysteine cluster protein [Methylogaea oryzae]|uniref:YkgJ family cysteine cluster protein n=1 Tax=Methylogaea oryzae TaxID=1295382 RepID=A0A8D5AIL1_9GAMM|nr:YkgJ family cysteine cluster protein [Methylogaea oryzae]BBL69854.1 hypothetical protein MoryE10_04600 [Methylogaea oryzae]
MPVPSESADTEAADSKVDTLAELHADIDARVSAIIADGHGEWLCRVGCDACCRRLAAIPDLTEAEWLRLREGLAELSPELLREISRDMAALAERPVRPIVCPLLDRAEGACRVYAHRPVACRTYGFYVQRDQGLYCKDIEAQVAEGRWAEVVWGNHDAVDRRLSGLGGTRHLTEWFFGWKR